MSLRTEAWQSLAAHAGRLRATSLGALIHNDLERPAQLTKTACGLTLDLSKELLDAPALRALTALARASELEAARESMADGEPVNRTEERAALHMALRFSVKAPEEADVPGTLDRLLTFAEEVRQGRQGTKTGPYTDVINIGIGGSDLGPAMAAQALLPYIDGPRLHFVSNVDGAHFIDVVRDLEPSRTLVVICSKSFTTQETMANARLARDWLGAGADAQMAGVSTNIAACAEFGVPEERVFGFWDWVGGRYSLWSAIGLSLAIGIGAERFRDLLAGAARMDRHFLDAPLEENLPVLYGLTAVWRRNCLGTTSTALIPYDQRLVRLPAYLQQLELESLGKRVDLAGQPVAQATSGVLWGEPGTNAQHSFFQLLHQGSDVIPVDFIASISPTGASQEHHEILLANCLAQSQALALGRSTDEVAAQMRAQGQSEAEIARLAPHRTFPGNRPSTTILLDRLDPETLGALIAFFEHKVFVQAVLWGINPFDQWGVELGKVLAAQILPALRTGATEDLDPSTAALIQRIRGAN
ncbi:MAG: glucose-6-phosphate isomerase [Pseudomonadota bacterium]